MKYDPRLLTVDYDKWQHGSGIDEKSMTTYLAEVIYQGLSGKIFGEGEWTKKRNVWRALTNKIGVRTIKKYFEEGMRRNGLEFHAHTAAVEMRKYDEK